MIGEKFGNYRAVSLLGEGGMGAVYLAEHPGIGRRVAVKVLHKNFTRDEHLLARFLNEARAANAIRHPNIIEILDSGVMPDGTPFLVMELLEGESLAGRLRRAGPLQLAIALDFIDQTASALGAAHAKGIVHRDLKPDNLFVIPDSHDAVRERIKVLDFGIAKLQQGPSLDSVKTRTGTLMGTPIYMSPEQCLGTKAVDQRSDVYSLGVIFYEMLTGQPPFVSEGFGELVNMHLNVSPAPLRTQRPDVPAAIEGVVLKMLAKSPDERFLDMAEVERAVAGSGAAKLAVGGTAAMPVAAIATDAGRRAPAATPSPSASKLRATTFSTGVGERVDAPARSSMGAKLAIAGIAAAAVAAGIFALRRNEAAAPAGTESAAVIAAPAPEPKAVPPAPVAPPPEAPAPVARPAPRKVTLRLVSHPAGATVTDEDSDAPLGTTPLVLTRPIGGAVKLRFEKDGFGGKKREIQLDGDHTVDLTLEQKKVKVRQPTRERSTYDEPAKL